MSEQTPPVQVAYCFRCNRELTRSNSTLAPDDFICDVCVKQTGGKIPNPPPPLDHQSFLLHALAAQLRARAEWHRQNQNDPHGISSAVICTLEEIANSVDCAISPPPPAEPQAAEPPPSIG